jgi:hypothetical protein
MQNCDLPHYRKPIHARAGVRRAASLSTASPSSAARSSLIRRATTVDHLSERIIEFRKSFFDLNSTKAWAELIAAGRRSRSAFRA